MLTVILCVAVVLVLWGLLGSTRRCRCCGARIERGEAPFDRIPVCWRCW